MCCLLFCFFFKQKTASEVRISDWSSDVCSSDLRAAHGADWPMLIGRRNGRRRVVFSVFAQFVLADLTGLTLDQVIIGAVAAIAQLQIAACGRSAERRVGKECGSTCRYRW